MSCIQDTECRENGNKEDYLFSPEVLTNLDSSDFRGDYKNGISPLKPGPDLCARPLSSGDYDKGYLDLLTELTIVGDISRDTFLNQFYKMKACGDNYYIIVIEDLSKNKIIGTATLVIEKKFIHHVSSRARVEDVVVSNEYRGLQLGKVLLDILVCLSKKMGSYKVSLECKDHNVKFYEQFGFEKAPEQNFMHIRYFD
ncbi:glucosamine 6-phosphate N-acetyltransferase-like [Biomphalaria glabrata]|uniref:Glucosamine 6-phosphate N-acetyltransferase n=1 Tax=Biomphalaria glabrata TaxID=6526 RepID=A0A9W2ZYQ0_BIOGL|nr:glucosamine 6-phosphate N-acetyltransferase-like [Biomphalaria glabrata]XP_055880185.1 glucosamine 6-phosphate N-acetyltransferase-like [Biomphalaria glabrata]XP_055880186.1 glucosamine 6-phosphate N-acetyltransferase-like [Biomphalaria glabrata]XP_055880187.1 glucosamine 6-phosphate N-acetyltransferase-like [Biomphalaria glabrata]